MSPFARCGHTRVPSLRRVGEGAKWQLVAWAVAVAITVFVGTRVLGERRSGPEAPPVRIEGAEGARGRGRGEAAGPAGKGGAGGLYVHVAGAVRRPGLLRVQEGARVAAAIARAGGAVRGADLTAVNLAQPLEDGQQVIVPRGAGASAGGGGTGTGAAETGAAAGAPSLATATVEQLEELDGIGPALAKRIVEYRESHGGFRSVEELREVEGIGEKRFAALSEAVRP